MCIKSGAKNGQQLISEVIVRGTRNIKQNRNWFYFKFSVESSSFIFNNFKMEKFKLTFESCTRVSFCQNLLHFALGEIRTVKRIVMALMPSLIFRCFSLFLPHLRTLAQEKRSENCPRFGIGRPSLCLYPLLSRSIIFFPALTMAARAKKKRSDEAICSRYPRALSGFWARLRILNLIARLC